MGKTGNPEALQCAKHFSSSVWGFANFQSTLKYGRSYTLVSGEGRWWQQQIVPTFTLKARSEGRQAGNAQAPYLGGNPLCESTLSGRALTAAFS